MMTPIISGCRSGPGKANSPSQSRTAGQARSRQPHRAGAGQRRTLRNPGNRAWAGVGGVVSEDAEVSAPPPSGSEECRLRRRLPAVEFEPVSVPRRSVPGAGRPGLLPLGQPVSHAEPPGRGRLPLAARRPACAAASSRAGLFPRPRARPRRCFCFPACFLHRLTLGLS